ncbi:MAG: PQQ-binding-like beta-propeller repeat protein [Acidobacteriota bacterium]
MTLIRDLGRGAVRLAPLSLLACCILSAAVPVAAAPATELPPVPAAVASFGGAVLGDHLYVYGGHIGRTHQHSVDNLSHRFYRLPLTVEGAQWEDLGEVPGLQGLPLVAVGDEVCRVGGLTAHNAKGEEEDLHSIAEVACYHPERQSWRALPDLPVPRSSHDVAVDGQRIFAVGGWQLRGKDQEAVWLETLEILDLSAAEPAWVSVPQPFQRRALSAAAYRGELYAMGGLGQNGTSQRVDVFDPQASEWREGQELPSQAGRLKGFGLSAFGVADRLYVSGADGTVHALGRDEGETEDRWLLGLGRLSTPRFFHRLLPHADRLLFVGGASSQGHLDSVETLAVAALKPGAVDLAAKAAEQEEKKADSKYATAEATADAGDAWPGFRGHGNGQADFGALPTVWSEDSNIAWRRELPGYGQSAPIAWGTHAYVTSIVGEEKEALVISALDLATGEVTWRRRFPSSHPETADDMRSHSAPTPVADERGVYVFFESGDVVALDHQGETLWRRDLVADYGDFAGNHGIGSSPVLTADSVVLQVAHSGPSYLLALDKTSGEIHWKVDRPTKTAWSTPLVVAHGESEYIVTSGGGRVEVLDGATGTVSSELEGIDGNNIPSVVVDGDLLIAASSKPGQSRALRWDRDQAALEEVWVTEDITSGFGSPLLHGDCALLANKAGVVACIDRTSGEVRWRQRVGESSWASPIAAGDYVYYFTRRGLTTVLLPGASEATVVQENKLPTEDTVYGVAAVPGAFLVRTGSEVVRIGTPLPAAETVTAER